MKIQRFSLPLILSFILGGLLCPLQPTSAQILQSDDGVTSTNSDGGFSGGPEQGGIQQATPPLTLGALDDITTGLENGDFFSSPPEPEPIQPAQPTAPPPETTAQEEAESPTEEQTQQEQQQVPEQPEEPEEDDEEQMQQQQQQQPVRGLW